MVMRSTMVCSMKHEHSAALVALAILVASSGCNRLYPVGGQLVWEDGQPANELAGAMVYFESADHSTVSRGKVRADGRFQLTTESPESSGPDGAPAGMHRAYLVDGSPSLADLRFRDPATSGLQVQVPTDGLVLLKIARAPAGKTSRSALSSSDEGKSTAKNRPDKSSVE